MTIRPISVGGQRFQKIRSNGCFYVDKTGFIAEWWNKQSEVTLLTRPRRFGKTLLMGTVESFFSLREKNQEALFSGLAVWNDEAMRPLAGAYPVISLTWSGFKGRTFQEVRNDLILGMERLCEDFEWLLESPRLKPKARRMITDFSGVCQTDSQLAASLFDLCRAVFDVTGVKPIVLLDEYDTPLLHSWEAGYWDDLVCLLQKMMNLTFKANPCLERGLITGITRIGKESIFSDLNNPDVVSVTTPAYETCCGFTEQEVLDALDEYGLEDKASVKRWYDGYRFGNVGDIYNPWSVVNYLSQRELKPYWANSSDNKLVGNLIQQGSEEIKTAFETLLQGGSIVSKVTESLVFKDLDKNWSALWSLLLVSGYLKTVSKQGESQWTLALTNREVTEAFEDLIDRWFDTSDFSYEKFIQALLARDVAVMNRSLNSLSQSIFSFFDTNSLNPERFYHGFVLGLLVSLKDRYIITSNRESGFGRYDVVLEPRNRLKDEAFILEFKAKSPEVSASLEEVAEAGLKQIAEKAYAQDLMHRGLAQNRIHAVAIAFSGKTACVRMAK